MKNLNDHKVERVGLWVHCFRSLPDHHDLDNQRFFAGCRWIFNPFTEGYDRIRNFLTPRKSAASVRQVVTLGCVNLALQLPIKRNQVEVASKIPNLALVYLRGPQFHLASAWPNIEELFYRKLIILMREVFDPHTTLK